MTASTRQGKATALADKALILARVDGLVAGGLSLRGACLECGLNHNNYYRWKAEADTAPRAPKAKLKRGRKAKFDLSRADARRLRFWRLVKGSIPLAVEAFIAEGLTGCDEPYFAALRESLSSERDTGHRASPELARALRAHWQSAVQERRVVSWPMSIQRACRVTAAEEAEFRGKKAAESARGMERRGHLIRTAEGETIPWYAGAIWESDDMSCNDPFRFHDAASGQEMVGRQMLATIDAYSLHWLGCSHIGRDRDSYRAEDIACHFREIVEAHGLPLIWRIEKGRWDNNFIWGISVGRNEAGEEIRWGGLQSIIHIQEKHTSQGKANVEGAFDLLQAIADHGFNGQTLSIGRQRGEFEEATRQMLRVDRDPQALAKFWTVSQSADAMALAMQIFNARPKKRHTFGNETRVPNELWAECVKRPLPADHAWLFHAVKTKATVRRGIIEVRAPHYPLSFRFRAHGGSRMAGAHFDNGHEVLVAFTPSAAWEGCVVFNADRSARNREGWAFAERIGVAEHMVDALQEDLYASSYSPGAKRAAAQVRKETRLILSGSHFQGRRVSHAQDSFGNQLTAATQGQGSQGATPAPEPEDLEIPARATTPAAAPRQAAPAPRLNLVTPPRGQIATTGADFDEADELAALSGF